MSIYKRGQTWHADITVTGRERFRGSLGTTDKAVAQRLHDEIRAGLHKKQAAGHSWYDAVAAWLPLKERSKSDRDVILAYDPGDLPLTEVTADSFGINHHKPATYRKYRRLFRGILNNAVKLKMLAELPPWPDRAEPDDRIRYLTSEEIAKLFAELPAHLEAPALFALSTGLRQANVLGLEWSRVSMERRMTWVAKRDMKGRKALGIPLSANAIAALEMVKGQHDRWCFTYRGDRMAKIKGAWNRSVARAGIEDFHWHDLRHCWATTHVMNGTPLEVLQKLGGWATLDMVLKYAHLAPSHLAQFADNHVTNHVTKGQRLHSSVDRALPS